jgi:hypothetical protein
MKRLFSLSFLSESLSAGFLSGRSNFWCQVCSVRRSPKANRAAAGSSLGPCPTLLGTSALAFKHACFARNLESQRLRSPRERTGACQRGCVPRLLLGRDGRIGRRASIMNDNHDLMGKDAASSFPRNSTRRGSLNSNLVASSQPLLTFRVADPRN